MTAANAPLARIRAAVQRGEISPDTADYIVRRLKAFRDAEEGHRAVQAPFAPPQEFEPDARPGTARYDTLRSVVDGIDQELLTDGLQARMGTDAALQPEPVTLRDHLAAAVEAHTGTRL